MRGNMTREIKFRAWYKYAKKMALVNEIKLRTSNYMHLVLDGESCIHYFGAGDNTELMQYTGLKDSQGKDIYDGDIVKAGLAKEGSIATPFVGRVYWFEREFQWWITDDTKDPITGIDYDLTFLNNYRDYEVIGNIYEHWHLLPEDRDN